MFQLDRSLVKEYPAQESQTTAMSHTIRLASYDDLDAVSDLFDAYRQFYKQPSDLKKGKRFLKERLTKDQAKIFICHDATGSAAGFALLYPSFCSVAAAPVFVLYDLFVTPSHRCLGVGAALLQRAQAFAQEEGAVWLKLETAIDNHAAQALYERMGWERDNKFFTYHFSSAE